jgi:hypothetical protein
MRKNLYRKIFAFLIVVIIGVSSFLPSVVSNNSEEKSKDLLTVKEPQPTITIKDNYGIIWCGDGFVEFIDWLNARINLNYEPDETINITIPGPNLCLIFLLGTNISLEFFTIFPRSAEYTLLAKINGKIRADKTTMKLIEPGSNSNILGMGYLLENVHNKTVNITIKVTVSSNFPRISESFTRNIVLNIKTLYSNSLSKTSYTKDRIGL